MKILVVAGGGGHFAPAIAFIEALPREVAVFLVVRKFSLEGDKTVSLEYKTAESLKIPFYSIMTGRLQRVFTKYTLFSLFKIPVGFIQSFFILAKEKPDVIVSFGGYVSVPVTVMGFFNKIPIVIHEQTLGAGLANRIASKFAKKICVSFDTSLRFFPKEKTIVTGNPFRKEINQTQTFKRPLFFDEKFDSDSSPLLYITGGSQGSREINRLIAGCAQKLLKKVRIVHQTGQADNSKDYKVLLATRETFSPEEKKRYIITPFIDSQSVGFVLHYADIIVSRSGMNTITELMVLEKPSLLIPLPSSQGNEQYNNARFFAQTGLGKVLDQDKLTPESLYKEIMEMISNITAYKKRGPAAKALVSQNASKKLVETALSVVG